MSRSNPTAKNPAVRFMSWRGGEEGGGRLTWYDKEAEEEQEVKLPFSFMVLDELNTITGFSEKDHSGFWSNEVKNLQNDELIVRTSAGIVARGVYGKISDEIKSKGAKYAKSVYVAFKDDDGEMAIGNIKISGAALTAWIEFQKKYDVMQCAVFITDKPKKAKKGSNTYFVPVFEGQNVSEESEKVAQKLDNELQNYLSTYLSRKPDVDDSQVVDEPDDDVEIEDVDNDEAEAPKKEAPAKESPKAVPANGGDDDEKEKINLADVPF